MSASDAPLQHSRAAGAAFDPIRAWIRHRAEIHTGLGLVGNVAFVIGSVFFLFGSLKIAGVWLFIAGSTGMLIGSIGRAVVESRSDS